MTENGVYARNNLDTQQLYLRKTKQARVKMKTHKMKDSGETNCCIFDLQKEFSVPKLSTSIASSIHINIIYMFIILWFIPLLIIWDIYIAANVYGILVPVKFYRDFYQNQLPKSNKFQRWNKQEFLFHFSREKIPWQLYI